MNFYNPTGIKKDIELKPLSGRFISIDGKKIAFYYSWQEGSLYDTSFSDKIEVLFEKMGAAITRVYKRRAFDQDDVDERQELSKYDGVVYFGASSCSTSKFAAIYGGLIDSQLKTPTIVVTYDTFKNDCINANYENGTKTRCVYTKYPADSLTYDDIKESFNSILNGFYQELTQPEQESGMFSFPSEPQIIENIIDAQEWLKSHYKTDYSPVLIPELDKVEQMLSGTSLRRDHIVSESVYPNKCSVNVLQVATVAVMAGLKACHLPYALALVDAYGKAPLHACVISTNSFGFLPVIRMRTPENCEFNYNEHAISTVPNSYNAPFGRFLRLIQIAIGGWMQGENCFGVIGSQSLGAPAIVENPDYVFLPEGDTVSLGMGFCSQIGNFMNMSFERMMDIAKRFDYQTGLTVIVSPKRANELISTYGSLKEAGEYFQKSSLIPLKEFWEEWHLVFTKPQLELGANKGELQGYPKEYLRYFEDKTVGDDLVPAFPKDSIQFVVTGGDASKMMKAFQASLVTTSNVNDFK
ncbi:hypothetical protein L1D34_21830 [Vibrio mediterranei]|uniref:hypothetical protein n=1 Tax=Vibrio mediterranei TaxID=689 RepID=UPI001EFEBEDD|nr:hypothetical protein [Vibrio mediterranei]MCG9627477.1 hypothetical protein [Vibrio mediterranei]